MALIEGSHSHVASLGLFAVGLNVVSDLRDGGGNELER
jgi:hypothetical protein